MGRIDGDLFEIRVYTIPTSWTSVTDAFICTPFDLVNAKNGITFVDTRSYMGGLNLNGLHVQSTL